MEKGRRQREVGSDYLYGDSVTTMKVPNSRLFTLLWCLTRKSPVSLPVEMARATLASVDRV